MPAPEYMQVIGKVLLCLGMVCLGYRLGRGRWP